jgi:hypothetical protein
MNQERPRERVVGMLFPGIFNPWNILKFVIAGNWADTYVSPSFMEA